MFSEVKLLMAGTQKGLKKIQAERISMENGE
jgi:hypothetical protein